MQDPSSLIPDEQYKSLPTLDSLSGIGSDASQLGVFTPSTFTQQGSGLDMTAYQSAQQEAGIGTIDNPVYRPVKANPFYSAPVAFNPDARNLERYKDHPAYKRLGFSVMRDNEEHYNANTSWVGDARRAMKLHNFGAGFAQGFASNYEGLSTMFGGDMFTPAAIEYSKGRKAEKAAARAMSTRGGIGQSLVNIPYNLNYTLGIVASIAAEDLAMAAVAPETFGGSLTYGAYRTVKGGAKAAKSLVRAVREADKVRDIVNVRELYNLSKGVGKNIVNAFVPNTSKLLSTSYKTRQGTGLAKAGGALEELFTTARGFGAAYRDLRIVSLAVDESAVEAAGVRNSMENNLIRSYVNANGSLPEGPEMQRILNTAQEASTKDYFANLPVIYATNAITFNSLTLPYSLTGNVLKTAENAAGKVFAKTAGKAGTKVELEILNRRQLIGKAFTDKDYAKYALGSSIGYLKANLAEGFQEIYQEGVSATLEDYYTNHYFTADVLASKAFSKSLKKGLSDQMSQQGLEAFLGGFLGGAGVNAVTGSLQKGRVAVASAYGRFDKDFKKTYQERREKDKQALVDFKASIIEQSENVIAALAPEFTNFKVQADNSVALQDAAILDDRKAFEDIKENSLFNHVEKLSKSGVLDTFIEALENHKQLTDDEITQAFNTETREEAEKLIDDIISRSKSIAAITAKVESRYENPFLAQAFDMRKTKADRNQAFISYVAFEEAKKDFIFSYWKSDNSIERLNDIYNAASESPAVLGMENTDFTVLFSTMAGVTNKQGARQFEQGLEAELDILADKIAAAELQLQNIALSDLTAEQRSKQTAIAQKELGEASKKRSLLEEYEKALQAIYNASSIEDAFNDNEIRTAFTNAVSNYLDYVALKSNTRSDRENHGKLYGQLRDFFKLSEDQKRFTLAASALSDSSQFNKWYEVHRGQLQKAYDKFITNAYEKAQAAVDKEHRLELIQRLEEIGVAIDVTQQRDPNTDEVVRDSDLDRFINLGDVPQRFLSLNETDTDINGFVIKDSDTWNKIQDIFDEYSLLDAEFKADLEREKAKQEEVTEEEVTSTETTYEDRLIPLKREVIRVKSDDGSYVDYTVTTMLDGSLKAESISYDENGNETGRNTSVKLKDGLIALDAVKISAAKEDVVTIESTESGEDFMNPKKKAALTSEQKKKLGIEESVSKPDTQKRIQDNQVPVKREVIRITSEDGTYAEYTVTTMLDGSLKADLVSYDENGNELGTTIGAKLADNDIIQRDGLTSLDAVKLSAAEGEVVTVESTQSGMDFMNPKKLDRLSPEQKKKLGIEESTVEEGAEEESKEPIFFDNIKDYFILDKEGGAKRLGPVLEKLFRDNNTGENRYTDINDWINNEGRSEVKKLLSKVSAPLVSAEEQGNIVPTEETNAEEIAKAKAETEKFNNAEKSASTLKRYLSTLKRDNIKISTIVENKVKLASSLTQSDLEAYIKAADERIAELEANEPKTAKQEEMNFEPAEVELTQEESNAKANEDIKTARAGGEIAEEDVDLGCK